MPSLRTIDDGLAYGLWDSDDRRSRWPLATPWPPPPAIKRAVADLKKVYEALNGKSVTDLMKQEDAVSPHAMDAGDFGDRLARAALGEVQPEAYQGGRLKLAEGRPYFESPIKIPRFEVSFDDNELVWSGEAVERNPSIEEDLGINPAISQWGFDLVDFKVGGFKHVLLSLGIPVTPGQKIPGETGGWLWEGDDIRIVTANDPITGKYYNPGRRADEKDFASYMGLEGSKIRVAQAKKLIHQHAKYIKDDVGSRGLQYIDFGDPEPSRVDRRGQRNPGRFTEKGERMYQDIKATYEAEGESRAAELAARTVYARSKEVPGLLRVGLGRPPGVPNRSRR